MEREDRKEITSNVMNMNINFDNELVSPSINIDKRTGLIKWGVDNLYPDYILDVYQNKSAIHKKIIDRKVSMTTSQGMEFNINNQELVRFMNNNTSKSGDIEEVFQQVAYDYWIFGAFSLGIRWSKNGEIIKSIEYIPFHKTRIVGDDIAISNDWSRRKASLDETNIYPRFDLFKNKDKVQIYYHVNKGAGVDNYPNIDYKPAITSIETEGRIDNFHYNNSRKSFAGSYAVIFKAGKPTNEERAMISRDFEESHTGDSNGGSVVYVFANSPEEAPEFIPLQNNSNDEMYLSLDKRITQKILSAHGITSPQLFGIMDEGMTFKSKGELQEGLDIYQSIEITPVQKLFEKTINKFLRINSINEKVRFNQYKIIKEEDEQ